MKDPLDSVAIEVRQVLAGLAVFAVAAIVVTIANPTLAGTIGVLLFFFVVMIGLHELGHFVMAKRAGMKITEFFIGFGPRLWSTKRGDTEYGLKAIPLGGYCKIIGMTNLEDIDAADEPRAYRSKGWWGKVSTVAAGPITHFVLAIMFTFAILVGEGDPRNSSAIPVVSEITQSVPATSTGDGGSTPTPAERSDLEPGDRILAVDGEAVSLWEEVTARLQERPGEQVTLRVERDGAERDVVLELLPVYRNEETGEVQTEPRAGWTRVGFAGLAPTEDWANVGAGEALWKAPTRTAQFAWTTLGRLGHMFSPSGISEYLGNFDDSGQDSDSRFVSPVGFGKVANDAVRDGWVSVFALLLTINLFVGILNLVPLLPFDGGHIAVASYEAVASRIRGRRVQVDFARLLPVMVATLSVLAFIFLSSLFLDIANPIDSNF